MPNTTLFSWSTEKCKCHFEVVTQSAALFLTPFSLTVSVRCSKTRKTFYCSLRANMHWLNRLHAVCGRHIVEVWSTLWNKTIYKQDQAYPMLFFPPGNQCRLEKHHHAGFGSLCVVWWRTQCLSSWWCWHHEPKHCFQSETAHTMIWQDFNLW